MVKLSLKLIQIVLVQLFIFSSVIAQNDVKNEADTLSGSTQTYSLQNATFFYKRPYFTPDGQVSNYRTEEFKNLSVISISGNGKIALTNSSNRIITTELKYAKGLKISTGSNLGTGILIGAPLGAIIGLVVGFIIDAGNEPPAYNSTSNGIIGNGFYFEFGKPLGAAIGLLTGALVGGIIGSQIQSEEYLNLTNYNEEHKRNSMINFINNK